MGQLGFFDADKRLEALSARGDPLEAIDHLVGRAFAPRSKRWCSRRTSSRRAAPAGSRSMPPLPKLRGLFGASTHAWQTEVVGVAVFLVCAVGGLFSRSAIAVGYVMHGLWDLSHCLSGSCLGGLSITEIPLGYGLFCSTYDFVVACYLMISDTAWHASGKFDLYFWRHRP